MTPSALCIAVLLYATIECRGGRRLYSRVGLCGHNGRSGHVRSSIADDFVNGDRYFAHSARPGAVQLFAEAGEALVARPGGRAACHLPSVTASRRLQIAPADCAFVAASPARRSAAAHLKRLTA